MCRAVWCERWENKENKIEGRNKNYKTSPPTVPYSKQSNAQTDDNVKIFLMPGLSLLQKKNRNIFCYFILSINLFSTVSWLWNRQSYAPSFIVTLLCILTDLHLFNQRMFLECYASFWIGLSQPRCDDEGSCLRPHDTSDVVITVLQTLLTLSWW